MKRFLFLIVLIFVSVATASSPVVREHLSHLNDGFVERGKSLWSGLFVPDSVVAKLDAAEKTLLADQRSLDIQRTTIRQTLHTVQDKIRENEQRTMFAKETAVRYRNALAKTKMDGKTEIVLDGIVYSPEELEAQIKSILTEHTALSQAGEDFRQLFMEGQEREQEIAVTFQSITHALDRLPVQRLLAATNETSTKAGELISEIVNIHKKTEASVEKMKRLLRVEEIEKRQKAVKPATTLADDRLQQFLSDDTVGFAGN